MKWSELDGADWLLPAARNKTKLDLLRPLSKQALDVIGPRSGEWVFTIDGRRPMRSFGNLKATFDKAVARLNPDIPHWQIHDLRRTARSLLSRAGVPADHAERVLGHVIGGVRGIYDRHEYREEKSAALTALARAIDRIVSGRPTLVRLERVTREADANA
jgi:integrase